MLYHVLAALGFTTLILFLYLFPDARFVPRWALFPALVWIANVWEAVFFPKLGAAHRWDDVVGFAFFFIPALCAVGSQIYRYRRISTPAQRQQSKWVIFGTSIGFGGFLVLVVLQGVFAGFDQTSVLGGLFVQTINTILFTMIPLSIGVAILRSRLFDIDVLINRTLVYGTLTAILIFTYLAIVVCLQYVIRTLTGQESRLAIVVSTLTIAALFNPVRHRVQLFVDRRFYRSKYDAKKTLEAFSGRLRDETDLGTLSDHLVGVVGETMRPAHSAPASSLISVVWADGYVVGPDEIDAELLRIGHELAPGDIVLVNTSAGARYGQGDYLDHGCGMGRAATLHLTRRGGRVVGTDAWSWEAPFSFTRSRFERDHDPSIIWEGHFAGSEIPYCQIEKLANLEQLPDHGFEVISLPVKVHEGSGGWSRPVAIIED